MDGLILKIFGQELPLSVSEEVDHWSKALSYSSLQSCWNAEIRKVLQRSVSAMSTED